MKYVLVIPDGVADEPQDSLGGKTPLQAANVPHMDAVATQGIVGRTDNVPASMPSGSDVGTMSLFGYDPLKYHTGRAPIEAAAMGIELAPDDWAIRCNLVTMADGLMKSFTAGQIPNDLGAELIQLMQKSQCGDTHWKFYPGVSYRNILVYRGRGEEAPFSTETSTTPPHDLTDQPVAPGLPSGPGSDLLKSLMDESQKLFADHAGNQARGENAASNIWLWGEGKAPALEPFVEKFGKTGAVITAVDLLRGLGKLIGWDIIDVEGATGYLDTDYAAKGQAAIETLKGDVDFVVVHVEATDEASHEGEVEEKLKAVEQIDEKIVGPVHEWLKSNGDYRLLISPDHPTYLRTKTHSHGDCPFTICGSGVTPDAASEYHEIAAAASSIGFKSGADLMPFFLNQETIG
ncbi:MAG: cofactor-independent phosphoglycerate mutase [Planctomycetaceae bacterium]|nr:cofactor-independent phosphoglycerate mutase [Planctomycetaceae bacterium]MDG2390836.1 cofactor-independent phosphoglycerate mutase [Planctomycetaceae bacterium]